MLIFNGSFRSKVTLSILAMTFSLGPGVSSAERLPLNSSLQTASALALDVIQCPQDRSEPPRVEVAPVETRTFKPVIVDNTTGANGLYTLRLRVPPGNLLVKLRSSRCIASLQIGMLAGHERTLSVALLSNVATFAAFNNALLGLLPIRPSVAFLVDSTGAKRVLDVQDGAYYIERVPPGRYLLRMEIGGFQSEVPLDLSGMTYSNLIRKDIKIDEIRNHLGEILKDGSTLEKCRWCY